MRLDNWLDVAVDPLAAAKLRAFNMLLNKV